MAAQQQQAKEEKEAKEAAEARRKRCIVARDRLQDLQQWGRVYNRDDKGERFYLTDQEREAEIAKSKESVSKLCD